MWTAHALVSHGMEGDVTLYMVVKDLDVQGLLESPASRGCFQDGMLGLLITTILELIEYDL